jgi:hypothetical protein
MLSNPKSIGLFNIGAVLAVFRPVIVNVRHRTREEMGKVMDPIRRTGS